MTLYLNRSIVDAVVNPVLGKFQLVSNLSNCQLTRHPSRMRLVCFYHDAVLQPDSFDRTGQ